MNREKFLSENKIHFSYHEFFDNETLNLIEDILSVIGEDYTPIKENIFKVFRYDPKPCKGTSFRDGSLSAKRCGHGSVL